MSSTGRPVPGGSARDSPPRAAARRALQGARRARGRRLRPLGRVRVREDPPAPGARGATPRRRRRDAAIRRPPRMPSRTRTRSSPGDEVRRGLGSYTPPTGSGGVGISSESSSSPRRVRCRTARRSGGPRTAGGTSSSSSWTCTSGSISSWDSSPRSGCLRRTTRRRTSPCLSEIRARYLRTWFAVDFLAALPFEYVRRALGASRGARGT